MSKVKISALLSMILLTVTTSTAIASANEISEIKFNSYVNGKCFTIYGYDLLEGGEFTWAGYGRGKAGIIGSAEPPFEPLDAGELTIYKSETINALGFISISWIEIGRDPHVTYPGKHWLDAVIYPTESTIGYFSPDNVLAFPFSLPGSSTPTVESGFLSFEGIHLYPKGYERISGLACWFTVSGGFTEDPEVVTTSVMLVDMVKTTIKDGYFEGAFLYWAIWADQETSLVEGGPTVPAAKVFMWNVEVVS